MYPQTLIWKALEGRKNNLSAFRTFFVLWRPLHGSQGSQRHYTAFAKALQDQQKPNQKILKALQGFMIGLQKRVGNYYNHLSEKEYGPAGKRGPDKY